MTLRAPLRCATLLCLAVATVAACAADDEQSVPASHTQVADGPCPEVIEIVYSHEATFETPERALAEALKTRPDAKADPADLDSYERVEHGEALVEFKLLTGDQKPHTWEIRRIDDGGWAIIAFRGCFPSDASALYMLEVGDEVTVRGVVIENTIDPCLFPTPDEICEEDIGNYLRIDAGDLSISVSYGGHPRAPCPNDEATKQATAVRVGVTVEIFAEALHVDASKATLSVCGSRDFYVDEVS